MNRQKKHLSPDAGAPRGPQSSAVLKRVWPLLALVLLLSACATAGKPNFSATDAQLFRDLERLPQTLSAYAGTDGFSPPDGVSPDTPIFTSEQRSAAADNARQRFFAPWQMERSGFKAGDALWALYALKPERGFIENLRPYPPERWAELVKNSSPDSFPNHAVKAITLHRADLRLMPTRSPYFFDPARPGQGYPFDYFQNSSLPPGAPVFISHVSADGFWGFAESASASGWVELSGLAQVDDAFIANWMSSPLAAIIVEETLLTPTPPAAKNPAATLPPPPEKAGIGTLLPFTATANGKITVLYPVRGNNGLARTAFARLSSQDAAPWPLTPTRRSIAALGNKMIGQPYGWGGYSGNRDCSALMRDLFLPFGLWLPRNSESQAKAGKQIDLKGLSPEQKEQTILARGKPFASLISMPGHIALYLGQYQGRAVIFHNIWGLRTLNGGGLFSTAEEGRAVVGKAVVTTLSPGRERRDISSPDSLLDRITGINILGD